MDAIMFQIYRKKNIKRKSSLSLGRKYTDRKYMKKDNEEETEIPQQNWETEVPIESSSGITMILNRLDRRRIQM